MNETDFHGSLEALSHLNPNFKCRDFRNHSPFLHEIVERPAGDQLHSDKKLRPTFSEIKNPNNIGMVDSCCCAGLMREFFRLRLHVISLNFHNLQSDPTTERNINGAIGCTHSTLAEKRYDLELIEVRASLEEVPARRTGDI